MPKEAFIDLIVFLSNDKLVFNPTYKQSMAQYGIMTVLGLTGVDFIRKKISIPNWYSGQLGIDRCMSIAFVLLRKCVIIYYTNAFVYPIWFLILFSCSTLSFFSDFMFTASMKCARR